MFSLDHHGDCPSSMNFKPSPLHSNSIFLMILFITYQKEQKAASKFEGNFSARLLDGIMADHNVIWLRQQGSRSLKLMFRPDEIL